MPQDDLKNPDTWRQYFHSQRLEAATEASQAEVLDAAADDPGSLLLDYGKEGPDSIDDLTYAGLQQLYEIVETAEIDDRTAEIILDARSPSGVQILERVESPEELWEFLAQFGYHERELEEDQDNALVFGYGGEIKLSWEHIDRVLARAEELQLFGKSEPPGTTLFKSNGGILVPAVRTELGEVNEELVRYLAAHPDKLQVLESRRFEELVAEIFRDFGYEIILTPRSKDGGLDIRGIRKDAVGTLLYLIECKRYAPTRPVGIEIVRRLYGVTVDERASCGVVVTTSHFTRGAKEFADRNKYQVSLRDYNNLTEWLKHYPLSKRPMR